MILFLFFNEANKKAAVVCIITGVFPPTVTPLSPSYFNKFIAEHCILGFISPKIHSPFIKEVEVYGFEWDFAECVQFVSLCLALPLSTNPS